MQNKLNRGIVRDALAGFIDNVNKSAFKEIRSEKEHAAYLEGAHDFAEKMKGIFENELNIHLSKDGQPQQRYRFHYKVGVLATSVEKWMTREQAESFAAKKGYRLELVRTTHSRHA